MQTFLPYPSFEESAQCLDRQRLGKQRVEGYQILRTLLGETVGWRNHPAVKMWKGREESLLIYTARMCEEWCAQGYKDTISPELRSLASSHQLILFDAPPPWWLGRPEFHASHRAALLHKFPEHYGQFGWTERPRMAYWWPNKNEER